MQCRERIIHHGIPGEPWEIIEADMFSLYNKSYLCIIDYYSKFPVSKKIGRQLNTSIKIHLFRV